MSLTHGSAVSSNAQGDRPTTSKGDLTEVEGRTTRRPNQGLKRAGAVVSSRREGDPWPDLRRLIFSEYRYCTMYDVNIVDGNIVSCRNIQQSLTFGPAEARSDATPIFDSYWGALKELCGKIRTGCLLELRFSEGRPVSARRSEGGRRFRRFLAKENGA
jgi:hypothetical protein